MIFSKKIQQGDKNYGWGSRAFVGYLLWSSFTVSIAQSGNEEMAMTKIQSKILSGSVLNTFCKNGR
jgi:hypothetical protein